MVVKLVVKQGVKQGNDVQQYDIADDTVDTDANANIDPKNQKLILILKLIPVTILLRVPIIVF